jgi:putative inorganic carbon (hco3(-)) transporter
MTRIASLLAIALFLLLVTLSLNYSLLPNLPSHDDKRVLELLIIGAALLWIILGGMSTAITCPLWKTQTQYAIYLLIALAGVSALLSASPRHAVLEICSFVGLFYVCQFTAVLWREYRMRMVQWLVYAIFLGAVFYMVGFYTGYLASFLENIPLYWPEPFFGFSNVRFFNQYQLWTLSLLCLPLLGFNIERAAIRRWLSVIMAAWWVLLFASASRGVLLAWIVAMLATAGCYRQLAWPLLRLQLTGFITGLISYGLLFYLLPSFLVGEVLTKTILRDTANDRIGLWKQAVSMIQAHPWFGVGPMHYAWYPNTIAAHPHNSVLQLAAEWGLPATVLMLTLAGYGVFCWLRRFNAVTLQTATDRHFAVVLFFTLVANACYSLVDGVIVMPLSQVMMAVVIGLMLGLYDNQQPNGVRRKYLVHPIFAGIVLVAMVWSVLPELLPRLLGNEQMIPRGYQTTGPRFWQEGGIAH